MTVFATDDVAPTLGHDFLQRSEAKLDFAVPHELSGVSNVRSTRRFDSRYPGLQVRRATPAEARRIRRTVVCPVPRKKRRAR